MPPPRIEWRAAARADLLAIIAYVAEDNPDAAQLLKNDIEAKIGRLPNHPKLYRGGRVQGTREMVVRDNYLVVYAEGPTTLVILRILHGAQKWPATDGGEPPVRA